MRPTFESIYSKNDQVWIKRDGDYEFMFLKPPDQPTRSPFEEAVHAARLITERSEGQKVSLCISGGLDSECMLRAFMAAKVNFEVCILRFKNELNMHDICTAFEVCDSLGIRPQVVDLDIIEFYLSEEYMEYAKLARSSSPQFSVHCFLALQTENSPVFAGDYFYFHNDYVYFNQRSNAIRFPEYKDYSVDRILKIYDRFGTAQFFNYTAEMVDSFVAHTRAGRHYLYNNSGILTKYDFKKAVYRDAGFDFITADRRTAKYTGFEKVKEHFAQTFNDPLAYEKQFRYPLEALYGGSAEKSFLILGKNSDSTLATLLKDLTGHNAEAG